MTRAARTYIALENRLLDLRKEDRRIRVKMSDLWLKMTREEQDDANARAVIFAREHRQPK